MGSRQQCFTELALFTWELLEATVSISLACFLATRSFFSRYSRCSFSCIPAVPFAANTFGSMCCRSPGSLAQSWVIFTGGVRPHKA